MRFAWTSTCFILLTFLVAGCARQPKLAPVKGKVVDRAGKPIGAVTVIFWPEDSKSNRGAGAVCDADGSFFLECLPGNYKATISPIRPKGATTPPSPQGSESSIPTWYQNQLTTTLTVKVPEGGTDNIILQLQRVPPEAGMSAK
jgi:hypothetical protein